jgi:hypothetical protein
VFQRVMVQQASRSSFDCTPPDPIPDLSEDFVRSLVIARGRIVETSVVQCAKVEEEGCPQFSQRECREIFAVMVCNVGTLLERSPILVAVEGGGEPTDPRVFVPSSVFCGDIRFRQIGVRYQPRRRWTERGRLWIWSRWTTEPAKEPINHRAIISVRHRTRDHVPSFIDHNQFDGVTWCASPHYSGTHGVNRCKGLSDRVVLALERGLPTLVWSHG